MLELSRTVRFCLSGDPAGLESPRDNTFSAWPAMRGLSRYYQIVVTCRGEADPATGYFINIKQIDQAVRQHLLPYLNHLIARGQADAVPMGELMQEMLKRLAPPLDGAVHEITLVLTPTLSLTAETNAMDTVVLRQQYEFSAAHRLHVPSLSDEENRATFGKCNNPAGHGHNYRVEVAVRCPIDSHGHTLEPATIDATVNEHAIEKLDHKHLNQDVPQFADLNPSVEHIVKVVWDMLKDSLPAGGELDEVKVWETGKTVCAYRGE